LSKTQLKSSLENQSMITNHQINELLHNKYNVKSFNLSDF